MKKQKPPRKPDLSLDLCRPRGCSFRVETAGSDRILHHVSPEGHDHMAPPNIPLERINFWAREVHEMMGWT